MLHLLYQKKPAPFRPGLFPYFLALSSLLICLNLSAEKNQTPTARMDAQGVQQVLVPAGSFMMGTKDITKLDPPAWAVRIIQSEQPQHKVTLSQNYWIDQFEVSNAQFDKFVKDDGYKKLSMWSVNGQKWLKAQDVSGLPVLCGHAEIQQNPDLPRMCVTWFEAEAYATWRGGRLPSEAEWEYAARGPSSLIYPWGNVFDPRRANVVGTTEPTPVSAYPNGVSWVGAYNMAGNAMEWVQDWLALDYYAHSAELDPKGPQSGSRKVEKGGWWGSNATVARSAYHHFEDPPQYQDHHIGFRVLTPALDERESR